MLRVGQVKHHKAGESLPPQAYTVEEEVVSTLILLRLEATEFRSLLCLYKFHDYCLESINCHYTIRVSISVHSVHKVLWDAMCIWIV